MPVYKLEILVEGTDNASGMLGKIAGGLGGLGAAAVGLAAGGLAAVTAGIGASVAAASEFEATLSGVQAVLNPTGEEMAALSGLALQLGKNTAFGASEAALAIEMLAKNGLDAGDIMGGAAEAALALAAATGLQGGQGLATAADIATDAMAIFKIEAADMATAINGIAGVTVASKFSINDYALAMAQGAGVAGAAGVGFADFNATIAGISPLFASGSDAGTSFKVMLQNLIPKSKDAAGLMQQLGLISAEGANQFYNADGSMRGMAEIAGLLEGALAGLSDEQRNNALSTIFGTDAMRAAVGLAEIGEQGFRDLAASLGEVDAAEQAATRLDNLRGDLEQLKGSLETAGIQLGQAFTPLLRESAQAALAFVNTHLVDRDWSPLIDGLTRGAELVAGFIGPIVELAAGFLAGGESSTFFSDILAAAQPTLDRLGGWVTSAAAWFQADLLPALTEAGQGFLTMLQPHIAWLAEFAETTLMPALESVGQFLADNLPGAISVLAPLLTALVDEGLKNIQFYLTAVATVWSTVLQPALSAMSQWIGTVTGGWDNLARGARVAAGLIRDVAAAIRGLLSGQLPGWLTGMLGGGGGGGLRIPGFAGGVRNFGGGLAVVGERGPELVSLPGGSDVYTAGDTRRMLAGNGGGGGGITINMGGVTVDSEERLRQFGAELERRIRAASAADFSAAVDGLILGEGAL